MFDEIPISIHITVSKFFTFTYSMKISYLALSKINDTPEG